MGDELYYNRVVGGVDGSRSGACNVPPGAVCVCVGNTKVAMFPQYEPGVYATNHTVSIHTGAEGASDYRPEWPAVQYIQVMMVWPGYPCTPLLDTGAETLDGKFIQVHCGGIALSEIKVFVDDDRQPFDVTWVDANYYGGGGSGTPACTEPHLEARAPTTPPARRRRRRRRAHRPAAASLVTPECARAARPAARVPTASAAHPTCPTPLAGGTRGGERRGRLRLGDHAQRRPHAHVPRGARGDDDRPARGVGGPVEPAVLRIHLRRGEGGGRSGARHGDLHAARRGDRAERRAVPGATGRAIPRKSAQVCAIL